VRIISLSICTLRPTSNFFHHSTTATEVRGLQISQGALQIDQAALGGLQENSQCARDGQALFSCEADTEPFIHEQQVRVFLLGQLNRLPFPGIKFRKSCVRRRCHFANHEPRRRVREPSAHGGDCSGMIEFVNDSRWDEYVLVQSGEDVFAMDLNEVVQRRGIGDNDDHDRRIRPLAADFFLAGHTHGGQICTPWGWPLITHDRMPRRYCKGVHRFDGTWYIVSRGLGFAGVPVRINCPSEVAEITTVGTRRT